MGAGDVSRTVSKIRKAIRSPIFGPGRLDQVQLASVFVILALAVLVSGPAAIAQTISTVAGNGLVGFSTDGGPATGSALNNPRGVTFDSSGNMYIADKMNHRVRRVSPSGIISTFVGNGIAGFSGDGGAAVNAQLNQPEDVCIDGAGNIYIADASNHRVRKVTPGGIISTVAGIGAFGYNGDNIAAVNAQLNRPTSVAIDGSGNLLIADASNHRIRKVSANGNITTVAGNGVAGYSGNGGLATTASLRFPVGIALDAVGNLYIADAGNHVVREVTPGGGIFNAAGNGVGAGTDTGSFSGDGGAAFSAGLNTPEDVVADSAGTLFIADTANNRIRKVNSSGVISTFAGTGSNSFSGDGDVAVLATLNFPWAVALDASGNLLIGDGFNNRVRKISPAGAPPPVVGSPSEGGAFTYYFAHLALGGAWQTTLTYINISSQTVTCQTNFFADSGAPLAVSFGGAAASSRTDTLAAGGSLHTQSTADPNAIVVTGWAQASCSGPVKASLLFRSFQGGVAWAEAGVNAMITPMTKFVTFAEQRTGIAYANPSAQPALVTVTAMNAAGGTLASMSLTLLAGAHGSANIGPLLGLSSFAGSIQITSTVPIVSLSLNFEAFPAFSSLPPGEL